MSEIPAGLTVETIYVVEATYAPDAEAKRPAVRRQHLERIETLLRDGTLITGGGFLDFSGALLLIRAETEEEALAVAREDVYLTAGVWTGEFRARQLGRVTLAS